jgi:hypothetical protein
MDDSVQKLGVVGAPVCVPILGLVLVAIVRRAARRDFAKRTNQLQVSNA